MLRVLLISCVLVLARAERESEPADVNPAEASPAEAKVEPAAASIPLFIHRQEGRHHHRDEDRLLYAPRLAYPTQDVHDHRQRIIENVYSPDYIEPTLVLDYRYLKSGGRDYTRGPGGQILILPPNVHTHEHKQHRDYDSLIEFLKLKNHRMLEAQRQRYEDLSHPHRDNVHHRVYEENHHHHQHDRHEQLWH